MTTQTLTDQQQTEQLDKEDIYGASLTTIAALEQRIEQGIDEHTVKFVLSRIADLQARIDRIFAVAALEARPNLARIKRLEDVWGPHLRAYGKANIEAMPKKSDGTYARKNIRLGAGGMFFIRRGGWAIFDSTELRNHLLNNPSKMLEMGLEITISLDSKARSKVINWVKQTGEALPGLRFEPTDDFATMKFGAEKAWTTDTALGVVKSALGRSPADHWDGAGDE